MFLILSIFLLIAVVGNPVSQAWVAQPTHMVKMRRSDKWDKKKTSKRYYHI